ncbi:MAG: hypothetical protein WC608_01665 [Parcubacteria group bacterium]
MDKFEKYLKNLARHEEEKTDNIIKDPRKKIIMHAGVRLNWIVDFIGNKKITWKKTEVPADKILFSGTNPNWNKILINKCKRSVEEFRKLLSKNPAIKNKFKKEAFFSREPILLRAGKEKGTYLVLDGMHRFVGTVLSGREKIEAFIPVNEDKYLPICEEHTVYDLIRGFQRNAYNKKGEKDLHHGLKLLSRTYENVDDLLKNRFDYIHLPDKKVQKIIKKILKENGRKK